MSETFRVGDVCEIVESFFHPENIGLECTITSALHTKAGWDGVSFHEIRLPSGKKQFASPECLRKKRPPPDWVKLCHLDEVRHEETSHA